MQYTRTSFMVQNTYKFERFANKFNTCVDVPVDKYTFFQSRGSNQLTDSICGRYLSNNFQVILLRNLYFRLACNI